MATNDFALLTVDNTGGALALRRKSAAEARAATASPVTGAASGGVAVLPDAAGERVLRSVKVNIEPVQEGSGDPAPDNVRPISGWTGAKVTRCGKNLIPNNYAFTSGATLYGVTATINDDGSIHVVSEGTGSSTAFFNLNVQNNPNIILPAGTYRVSGGQSGKVGISVKNAASGANLISPFTLTEPTGLFMYLSCISGTAYDIVVYPQLEVGSAATGFEPYAGEVFNVTFPSEAGTVYGGVLDVTAGTLTVDRAVLDLGTLTWVYNTTLISAAPLMNSVEIVRRKPGSMSLMCSEYALFPGNRGQMPDKTVTSYNNSNATPILIRDDSFSDAASFKTAMSGVQLVYELAEPVVYNLTPVQIAALAGINTVRADCGSVDVEWVRDTAAAIEAANADTRAMIGEASGETASRSLAVGEYVTVGDKLYKVTSAVGAGETLTPGSNVTETTVGAELTALYNLINS